MADSEMNRAIETKILFSIFRPSGGIHLVDAVFRRLMSDSLMFPIARRAPGASTSNLMRRRSFKRSRVRSGMPIVRPK